MAPPNYKTDLAPLLSEKEPAGAKLCSINRFLKKVADSAKSASDSEKDNIIGSIPDTDHFSRKTKLELAILLKRPQPVFDVWKSDDRTFLSRTLQLHWIFEDVNHSPLISDPAFVVQDLFPNLPYSTRKRVLSLLGRLCAPQGAEKLSELYEKVSEVYGIRLAQSLIPGCDQMLIDSVIRERKMKLGHKQLLRVFEKYPSTALQYLQDVYQELQENMSNNGHANWADRFFTSRDSCPLILSHIAKKSPKEFMDLFEKFNDVITSNLNLSFGIRLTNHLLKYDKGRVIEKAASYSKILNDKQVIKRLNDEEFEKFFGQLLPQNVRQFQLAFEVGEGTCSPLHSWLEKYQKAKRFAFLEKTFQSKYKKSVLDFPEFVTSRLLLILDVEQREKWAEMKITKPSENNQGFLYSGIGTYPAHVGGYWVAELEYFTQLCWVAFKRTEESIPRIKQLLATESDMHTRGDLVSSLAMTCRINDDMQALKEVCQFVSTRFRNDSPQVRLDFLNMVSTLFNLLKLDEDHWKPINELLHISSINNEFSYQQQLLESVLEKSIHFRVKRDLPVDTQIQHFIKMKSRCYCRGESWCIATSETVLERKCLKLFTDHLSSMYPLTTPCPSDSAITSAILSLFESFAGWNQRSKSKRKDNADLEALSATEFPWLMKRLQDILDSYHEPNKQRVLAALNYDPKGKAVLNPRLIKTCPLPPVLSPHMKNDVKKLEDMMEEIIDFMLQSNCVRQWKEFLEEFREAGLPKLMEKYANRCLEIAEDDEETLKERSNAIYILAFLLPAPNFVDWASKFYPSEDPSKYEPTSPAEIEVLYGLRRTVVQSLSNLVIPSAAIPALTQFCKGDYLKLAIGSLYSTTLKSSPTPKLLNFLNDLVTRPVSVKKHGIRLMIKISTKSQNIAFLKNLMESEKHHSIRAIVLNRIFEFCLQNNSDEAWKLLNNSIETMTANDHPFVAELARRDYISEMPHDKLSEYFSLSLRKIEEITKSQPEPKWVKVTLIQCITPKNISFLEKSFLEAIFEQHLFALDDDTTLQTTVVSLAIVYLLYYSTSNGKAEMLIKHFGRLSGKAWETLSKDSKTSFPARQSLSYFIEHLAIESFNNSSKSSSSGDEMKIIFLKLQDTLRSARDPSDFFIDDLFLSFSTIFHSHPEDCIKDPSHLMNIGKDVGNLVDEIVKKYEPQVVSIFGDTLKRFISLCYKGKFAKDGTSSDITRILFIIQGILESTGSVNTQILGSQLLLTCNSSIPPKGHKLEEKYGQIISKLMNSENKTVRVFLSAHCRSTSNRGFDILV